MDDQQIIALFFQRDERALEETNRQYGGRCKGLARNFLQSVEDVEECVSDAYLAAWQTIPPARPHPFLTYLLKLVRNHALHRYWYNAAAKRRSNYTVALEEIEHTLAAEHADIEEAVTAKELARQIEALLDTWDKADRVFFIKRYWFGESYKIIAAEMGLSEKNVSVRLSRLRQKLKAHLRQEGMLV